MIDTIKIILLAKELSLEWNIEEIKARLQPAEKSKRALGRIRNMHVFGNNEILIIEGSLAKFCNGNNIQNFSLRMVESSINLLSYELDLPLRNGRVGRVDVGVNIPLNQNVSSYLIELFFLDHYQRITRHETTLRFENNSHRVQYLLYDKLNWFENNKKKQYLIDDIRYYTKAENLMRVELQIQERVSQIMKVKDVRVSDLYNPDFCKLLLKKWLKLYQSIFKKAIPEYPKKFKGNLDFEKFMKRLIIQIIGWERLNYIMKKAVKQKSLSASAKSKKLKQFRIAMLDNSNFEFQEHTLELNHKIKGMYVEALKQIFKMKQLSQQETVK